MIIGISGRKQSGKSTIGNIINDLTNNKFKIIQFANPIKQFITEILGCTREQLEDEEFKNTELGEEWRVWEIISQYGKSKYISKKEAIISHGGYYEPKELAFTPRVLLQQIGTDVCRNIHPNFWINITMKDYIPKQYTTFDSNAKIYGIPTKEDEVKYGTIITEYPNWIITDVRFPNEAKAIKDRNGFIIRVDRIQSYMKNKAENMRNGNYNIHESETALDNYQFDYIINNNDTIRELVIKVKEILIKEKILI